MSLLTAFMWGILPVFLTLALEAMDAVSITFYRFLVAALFVFLVLLYSRKLPSLKSLSKNTWWLLAIASAGLIGNYVLYLMGLDFLNPETAQVLIQLAPFLLMVGGILFYGESFRTLEWIGAGVLFSGLLVFFNDRIPLLLSSLGDYTLGVIMMFFAAITWALYGLLQKKLLRDMSAKQVTLIMYVAGCIVLLPFSVPQLVVTLDGLQLAALIFCCANTIIGYGAFTEAMHCWHASKVSAVISTAPLFTIGSMQLALAWLPEHFQPSDLNLWSYLGALMVVTGSILASVSRVKR